MASYARPLSCPAKRPLNSNLSSSTLRIGTRGSALARWQAEWVASRLREHGRDVELVHITTRGDREQNQAVNTIGGDGLFTKELQRSLLAGEIDLAVHSLKDLPTEPVAGLVLGAVPRRGPIGDVLVSRGGLALTRLPPGAVIGTGSQRRRAQLLHARPDLEMKDIRGNVDTRLKKLHAGDFDALVLAEAGLKRLGLDAEITEILPTSIMLPAVGQGALGIECRADNALALAAIAPLDDADTHQSVTAERAMLRALAGGCLAPVAAWGRVEADGKLRLSAAVLSVDGRRRLAAERTAAATSAEELGEQTAADLAAEGAVEIIQAARRA